MKSLFYINRGSTVANISVVTLAVMALAVPCLSRAQGGGMAPPFAGAKKVSVDEAVRVAPQQDKTLVPLSKAVDAAGTKLKKSPKDAAAKKGYVEALYKFGYAAEVSNTLSPPVKYRAALGLYRRALAIDPKHQPSLTEKQKIEDIYKGMPGGIPK